MNFLWFKPWLILWREKKKKKAFSASNTKDYQDTSHSLTCDLDVTACGLFMYRAPFVRDQARSRKCLTFTVAYMWMQSIRIFFLQFVITHQYMVGFSFAWAQ